MLTVSPLKEIRQNQSTKVEFIRSCSARQCWTIHHISAARTYWSQNWSIAAICLHKMLMLKHQWIFHRFAQVYIFNKKRNLLLAGGQQQHHQWDVCRCIWNLTPYMHHLYAICNLRQYCSLPPFSKPCLCFPVGTHKHETHHNRCKILGRSQVMMFLSYEMSTSRAKRCAMGSSKSWLTSRRNQPWPIVRSMTCMA